MLCADYESRDTLDPKSDWKHVIKNQVTQALTQWDQQSSITLNLPSLQHSGYWDKRWKSVVQQNERGGYIPVGGRWNSIIRKVASFFKLFTGDYSQSFQPVADFCGHVINQLINIDVIMAEHTPDASVFSASRLHKDLQIPWLVDFRDPVFQPYIGMAKFFTQRVFKKKVSTASCTINVSEDWSNLDVDFFKLPGYTIPNGFDQSEFEEPKHDAKRDDQPITFFYPGNIHPMQDVKSFFKFLQQLKEQSIPFVLEYWGNQIEFVKDLGNQFEVSSQLSIHGPKDRAEVLKRYASVDYLVILPGSDQSKYYQHGLLPGKYLEYLGTNRPIICISSLDTILERSISDLNSGYLFDSPKTAAAFFMQTDPPPWKPNIEKINTFSRKNQSHQLSGILNSCVE